MASTAVSVACANALGAQGAGGSAAARSGWRAGAAAGASYESNPRFERADGPDDQVRYARLEAAGTRRVGRAVASLSASGDLASYRAQQELDRVNYSAGFDVAHAATSRLALRAGASARTSLSPEVTQGGAALPLAPLTRSRTAAGAAGGVYRLSPRLTATADASVTSVRYSGAALAGGTARTGDLTLARRFTPLVTVGARYRVESTAMGAARYTAHSTTADWARRRGPLDLRAAAGATLVQSGAVPGTAPLAVATDSAATSGGASTSSTGPDVQAAGDVSASYRRGRLLVGLGAGRVVLPAFGVGRVLATDRVSASVERAAGVPGGVARLRSAGLRLAVEQAWSADPGDPAVRLAFATGTAEWRVPLPAGTWLTAGAFVRRRSGALPPTSPLLPPTAGNPAVPSVVLSQSVVAHGLSLSLATVVGR